MMDAVNSVVWSAGMTLDQAERVIIEKAMLCFQNNRTVVAQSLGIATRTLYDKLNRYELMRQEEQNASDQAQRDREAFLLRARGIHPAQYQGTAGQIPSYESSPQAGMGLESTEDSTEESAMSMPQRKEIQDVLPSVHAVSGANKNRRRV